MALTIRTRKQIAAFGLLMVIISASCVVVCAKQIRCELIHWSNMKEVSKSLYVDPDMSQPQVAQIVQMTVEAKQRVAQFYGEAQSTPIIIAGQDERAMGRYLQPGNRTATTYLYFGKAYVVLGPDGLSVDVVAHEFMHAELSKRIGGLDRQFKIPTWFDSGLAMQADNREGYSEKEFQRKTEGGKLAPSLSRITSDRTFYTSDYWVNYATSKHEVNRWFKIVRKQGLADFLRRVRNEPFADAYESTEKEYATHHQ